MGSRVLTLRLTAKCSRSQHRRLGQLFGMSAEMYNALLESWKGGYEWWKRHHNPELERFSSERYLSRYDLMRMFAQVRGEDERWAAVSVNLGRGVICRFDRSRKGFYDRCRKGETPGIPGFKAGTTPDVARTTNFCQETDHPQGGTQADATEQYASASGHPRI